MKRNQCYNYYLNEIKEVFNLKNTVIKWNITDDNNVTLSFRKKVTVKDIMGAGKIDEKTNAVELKRGIYS